MQNSTAVALLAAVLAATTLTVAGCASSSASRAMRENAASLSLSEYREAARQLAVDIASAPKFKSFRTKEVGANGEVVVMLDTYKNETDNPVFNNTMRQLFTALEESFLENDLAFQQDLDPGLPNYSAAGARLDKQDTDDRYDQSTGTVSTGGAKKAVLSLQLEVQSSKQAAAGGGSTYEYVLYARLANSQKVSILSKSYPMTKSNR